ncbi:hypothetical protein CH063_04733 [Colletotrichum higginsianum]|uniref:Uncharacterized protein n=1 Tax=Colletotrichum higginsianum (strain IMI 349063) TaxID=759273 RepID=H1UWH1_COLHI|nr:hypothetical protein CH63R_07120 [Colletotrichum higginsianum IMI 349063]OBR08355.1 hypothetical protein CH63R_07120 [Colletotrichum higginsianum IMI 349063]CCF32322.1 hypothetical protein CH063_04733 [Colletotrichum higginsianum]
MKFLAVGVQPRTRARQSRNKQKRIKRLLTFQFFSHGSIDDKLTSHTKFNRSPTVVVRMTSEEEKKVVKKSDHTTYKKAKRLSRNAVSAVRSRFVHGSHDYIDLENTDLRKNLM